MASGKINGKVTGTSASKYNFWIEWSSNPYPTEGYWLVNATAYLQRNDGYSDSAYNLNVNAADKYVTINGKKTTSTQKGIDTRNSAKVVIASAKNIKVVDESNGNKEINISAAFPFLVSNLSGGSASATVTLDKMDISLPTFAGEPIVISNVTQTSADVSFTSNDVLDKIEYTLDNEKTWVEVNKKQFTISSLEANTSYSLKIRIRKKSNQKTKTSVAVMFATLPIYVTDILANDVVVDVGGSLKLPYSVLPENATNKLVEVFPQNSDIVEVVKTTIYGVSKGTTKLVVIATDGSETTKIIGVSTIQRVTGITTNTPELVIPKTASIELQYTVLPENADNKNVTIVSSDESVARVENNVVVGVENGTAIITITTEDGNYQTEVYISVLGDYIWYDYAVPLEVLNVNDIKNIKSNIVTIKSILLLKGYDVEALREIPTEINTPLNNIFDLLQNIEYNLDVISDNDAKSIYYVESKTIGEYASNRDDIWRWIQILNEMYNILTGVYGKWQYLLCTDGYPTIEGKKILTRGDFVG